ncbi:GntR family transcriptional regulator [Aliiroseovarius crassostreae]|uniref:GntR family transcriptional regulator n=1 Tax=Aliiroseovarius crassostreae TaxID=154981 RepID=UPI002202D5CF|nr:GntR family transcriptional regulator [Aliiroseovarius crassostreae]UWQ07153.1 GntR family transcriptional regulator [Aliiroseovarius crassostreae]
MTKPTLSPIEQPPQTLRDMVQERVRDAIIEGHFKPGERLVERPLCDQLGVSRTVIRETIRYLEAEGLVEILPGRGPIVARISREDARQIYDIRRMLETAAAESCARRITPERAKTLCAALVRLQRERGGEPGDLFRASADFYSEIFQGAGHHIAWEIVQRLNGRISRLRMMTLSSTDRVRSGAEHMQAICDAITSGDPQAARRAVNQHLDDTTEIAERLLAETEQGAEAGLE